jgi:hypothetical protein
VVVGVVVLLKIDRLQPPVAHLPPVGEGLDDPLDGRLVRVVFVTATAGLLLLARVRLDFDCAMCVV